MCAGFARRVRNPIFPGRGTCSSVPRQARSEEIRTSLHTRTFGKGEIVSLERTESTNTAAKAMALRGAPRDAVLAEAQTAGREEGKNMVFPGRRALRLHCAPTAAPAQSGRQDSNPRIIVPCRGYCRPRPLACRHQMAKRCHDPWKKVAGILTEVGLKSIQWIT